MGIYAGYEAKFEGLLRDNGYTSHLSPMGYLLAGRIGLK